MDNVLLLLWLLVVGVGGAANTAVNFPYSEERPAKMRPSNDEERTVGLGFRSYEIETTVFSKPCCTLSDKAVMHCFVRSPDATVWYLNITDTDDGRAYTGWYDLKGEILGDVTCLSHGSGEVDVMARSSSDGFLSKRLKDGKWEEEWITGPQTVLEIPSCFISGGHTQCANRGYNNDINIFQLDEEKKVWWKKYWLEQQRLRITDGVSCIAGDTFNVNCVGVSDSAQLVHRYATSATTWNDKWKKISETYVKGRPTVISRDGRELDVFTVSVKHECLHYSFKDGWQSGEKLPGIVIDEPACVITTSGTILCLAIGKGMSLQVNIRSDGEWSRWQKLKGQYIAETPSCILTPEEHVYCYVRNIDMYIVEFYMELSK